MIIICKGNTTLGLNGSQPTFDPDPNGGSIVIGNVPDELMEELVQKAGETVKFSVFGDYESSVFLQRIYSLLPKCRQGDIPDFKDMLKKWKEKHHFAEDCPLIPYCGRSSCCDCVVDQWLQELEEERKGGQKGSHKEIAASESAKTFDNFPAHARDLPWEALQAQGTDS